MKPIAFLFMFTIAALAGASRADAGQSQNIICCGHAPDGTLECYPVWNDEPCGSGGVKIYCRLGWVEGSGTGGNVGCVEWY